MARRAPGHAPMARSARADRSRREPIAVPRWAPVAVALALVAVAAVGAIAINAMLGLAA